MIPRCLIRHTNGSIAIYVIRYAALKHDIALLRFNVIYRRRDLFTPSDYTVRAALRHRESLNT